MLKLIYVICAFCISCGPPVHTSDVHQDSTATTNTSEVRPNKSDTQDPSLLCSRIAEIKTLPLKGDSGEDQVYDALVEAGDSVVPCLIEKVTDTTKMADPRQTPTYSDIRVGDIAYFILIDITKLGFTEPLPPDVKERHKEEGVYAYFRYVEKQENRKKLQSRLYEWYRQKYSKDEGKSLS